MTEALLNILDGYDRNTPPADVAAEINANHTSLKPNTWITERTLYLILGAEVTSHLIVVLEDASVASEEDDLPTRVHKRLLSQIVYRLTRDPDGWDIGTAEGMQQIDALAVAFGAVLTPERVATIKERATSKSAMLTELGRYVTEDDVTEGWAILERRQQGAQLVGEADEWLQPYLNRRQAFVSTVQEWIESGEGDAPDIGSI